MSNPKISVVIPIFNVGNYLEESLGSILNQSMIDDIEVIMVDDGSTDSSRYVIERYALDYDNFHAFHMEGNGVAIARNHGLQHANGDYVHFMNPKDYINADLYEKSYSLADENGCDILIGNAAGFEGRSLFEERFIENDQKISSIEECPSLLKSDTVSNKLFKRQFLTDNDIRFPDENDIYGDASFALKSYACADSMYLTSDTVYYSRIDGTSIRETPIIPDELEGIYPDYIKGNEVSPELTAEKTGISNDGGSVIVTFKANIDDPNEISSILVNGEKEHPLDVNGNNIAIKI